jgi:hypothetical protein
MGHPKSGLEPKMPTFDNPVVLALAALTVVVFSVKLAYHWRLARRVARWDRGLPVNRFF